jgi:SAM-dependent methyltransferase
VPQDPSPEARANDALIDRLRDLVTQLRAEQGDAVPSGEPHLASGSAIKGGLKRGVFRLTRPATRRYDRLAAELAVATLELAERLAEEHDRVRGDLDRLERSVRSVRSSAAVTGAGPAGATPSDGAAAVPDDYYWAFEDRMRGTAGSVAERLRQYERFAVPLRERLADGSEDPPLWLDLGCGLGELCRLVREWGWRVHGVDSSPAAVESCRAEGIDATLADVGGYLETRRGTPPAAVSAIQLIEHLPREEWIGLFERIHALLRPGGALLVETINGLNPEALTAYFVADVTHTWPGHPETLSLMAEHAGFETVEVVFMNPDDRGMAQDFAIWARKGAPAGPDSS